MVKYTTATKSVASVGLRKAQPFTKALCIFGKAMSKLEVGASGSFSELSSLENPDGLVVSYLPPVEAMLERAKQLKASELSPSEIERIRKNAPAIAISKEVHEVTFGNDNK